MTRANLLAQLRAASPQLTVGTLTAEDQPSALATLTEDGISLLHIDIMDGKVWPKTTVGPDFVGGLETSLLKDVHLLVDRPEDHLAAYARAGAGLLSFSIEYASDLAHCLAQINAGGDHILRGVSLNPHTDLSLIQPHLDQIDFAILLAIGPETGSETFFDLLPEKIATLRAWKPELLLTIDGAIKMNNVASVAALGPDLIATGSAIFDGKNAAANLTQMKDLLRS